MTDEALVVFVLASLLSLLSHLQVYVCALTGGAVLGDGRSLSHVCPQEAPAALDMLDRHTVRRVTAEQSGRVLHQFFARPIVREAAPALAPVPAPAEAVDSEDRKSDGGHSGHSGETGGSDDDETLTQLVARAEEKALVPLAEYELPPVRAICFGHDTCTCRGAPPDHLCVCCPPSLPLLLPHHGTTTDTNTLRHTTVQARSRRAARGRARPQPLPHAHGL